MKYTIKEGVPALIEFETELTKEKFIEWYLGNQSLIEKQIHSNGALLFRNTGVNEMEDFNYVVDNVTQNLKNYIDGFSPRTKLSSKVYTSTEYDSDYYITMHNELSYSSNWPDKLFFYCLIEPKIGGETPIADCRKVLDKMRPELVELFKEKGVRYIRNIHSGQGSGPSWQETFETENQEDVEHFCRNNDIEFEWRSNGMLRLIQNRPATISHPITQEEVWFNQVDQFHPSHLPEEIVEMLMLINNNEVFDLPMYGCFGDGTPINLSMIQEIRNAADSQRVINKWKKGDFLLVDNILMSHGRMPYEGDRKILVAME